MDKWLNKQAADSEKFQAIEQLEMAVEHLREAYDSVNIAAKLARKFNPGYDMSGNMQYYVLNYIDGAPDSLVDKIQEYIKDLETDPSEEGGE
jgi:hypothetical protein